MRVVATPAVQNLVAQYLEEKIGTPIVRGHFQAFAVYDSNDSFVAGIVVNNFRGTDCEISMASETPRWARKSVMRYIFDYVFTKCGCVRCTCIVVNHNRSKRTRRFLTGLNFVLEGVLRRAYDGELGAMIFGLLKEDCRFLSELRGGMSGKQIRPESTAAA